MEILSSGSFINLENREKIEQLKYTAGALAKAAMETEGFTGEEEAARKLVLEFWQGLEYICRESEQATIQNIFTGHFLERLRELRPAANISEFMPPDGVPGSVQESVDQTMTAQDEFLGVLAPENQKTEVVENQAGKQEIPMFVEDLTLTENGLTESILPDNPQVEVTEPSQPEFDLNQSEDFVSQRTDPDTSDEEIENEVVEVTGGLGLPEKEPYQFNKCTVTATIQLLPTDENADFRKAILSVRTHDFAPQISLCEISGSNLSLALAPEIEKVLAKYQADLPFKVMDKMRREKGTGKKSAPKTTTETRTVSQVSPKTKEIPPTQNTGESTTENISPARQSAAAETGVQGSLFSF